MHGFDHDPVLFLLAGDAVADHHGVAERLARSHQPAARARVEQLAGIREQAAAAEVHARHQRLERPARLRGHGLHPQLHPPGPCSGSAMVKVAPCPGGLSTVMRPPWFVMIRYEVESPKPWPSRLVVK